MECTHARGRLYRWSAVRVLLLPYDYTFAKPLWRCTVYKGGDSKLLRKRKSTGSTRTYKENRFRAHANTLYRIRIAMVRRMRLVDLVEEIFSVVFLALWHCFMEISLRLWNCIVNCIKNGITIALQGLSILSRWFSKRFFTTERIIHVSYSKRCTHPNSSLFRDRLQSKIHLTH